MERVPIWRGGQGRTDRLQLRFLLLTQLRLVWKTEREERQLSEQRKSTAAALKEKRRLELERLRPAAGAELPARRERRPTGEWSAGQSRRAFERKQ